MYTQKFMEMIFVPGFGSDRYYITIDEMSQALSLWLLLMLFVVFVWHCQTYKSLTVFVTPSQDCLLCIIYHFWCVKKTPVPCVRKMKIEITRHSCKLRYGFVRAGLIWLLSVHTFYLKFEKIVEAPYAWRKNSVTDMK